MPQTIPEVLFSRFKSVGVINPEDLASIPELQSFLPFSYSNYIQIMSRVRSILPNGYEIIEAGKGSELDGRLPSYRLLLPSADD